jgi:hypothetical protein
VQNREFFEVYKRLEPHKWVKFKAWKTLKKPKRSSTTQSIYIKRSFHQNRRREKNKPDLF